VKTNTIYAVGGNYNPTVMNNHPLQFYHAMLDNLFIEITPDFGIKVCKDIQDEKDDTMKHGYYLLLLCYNAYGITALRSAG
jgi:hypothetical protein